MRRACVWIAAALFLSSCRDRAPSQSSPATDTSKATFVGSQACANCHQEASARWQASQHAVAMQVPSRSAVLAPFRGESFSYAGVPSSFFQRDGRFLVHTDGGDGRLAEFEVKYTFGVAPLQQYLVQLPGGRVQALSLAWDARPAESGGQRWFHLYGRGSAPDPRSVGRGDPDAPRRSVPPHHARNAWWGPRLAGALCAPAAIRQREQDPRTAPDSGPRQVIRAGDPLHWTGLQQNWNFMCADCHSTNVRKNYDAATRTFRTTYSEISVGCEACHGPASVHVALAAERRVRPSVDTGFALSLDERRGVSWQRDPATGQPVRSTPRSTEREIEVCARCHSRRTQLTDAVTAADRFHDGFRVSLLEPGLYYPDGQMRDEVYNYGSFLQSRMYAAGVTCSDCHDPHAGRVRLPGNALCLTCHEAPKYDGPQHHLHAEGTPGVNCVGCHMPQTTYMVVDPRRDHSFRVPRPDRSVTLGVPNACQACHRKRGDAWAAASLEKRRPSGPTGAQTFAEAFAAFDGGRAGSGEALARVASDSSQPPIARATALARLERAGVAVSPDLVERAARDPSPLVRGAAAAFPYPPTLALLVGDPLLSVRLEAASALARMPAEQLPAALAAARPRALEEYARVQRFNADRPDGQLNLGTALAAAGDLGGAIAATREALALDPTFVPAYVNLADLHRVQGDEAAVERVLRQGLAHATGTGAVHHALGLNLVRQKRLKEALAALAEAARREPDNSQFTVVYAVALHDSGRRDEAIRLLRGFLVRRPGDPQARATLDAYERR